MPADRSQTERIRHRKAQVQAVARKNCKTCLEEGPQAPVSESMRQSRSFGQMVYYRLQANGQAVGTVCGSDCTAN